MRDKTTSLLTETADYNEPGSWRHMSEGWPEINGDDAFAMYVFANCVSTIPYGSYVLISQKGEYGAKESCLRVCPDYIDRLQEDFEAAGKPTNIESIKRRGISRLPVDRCAVELEGLSSGDLSGLSPGYLEGLRPFVDGV